MQLAFIGLLITGAGCISAAVGWALQKQAFNQIQNTDRSVFKTIHWWVGLLFVILTQPFYLIGISMVNQSTIGVVGPFSLVATMLLAKFYLNEPIRKWEYIGLGSFMVGCVLTLLYASMDNKRYTEEEFSQMLFSTLSLTYLFVNLVVIVVGMILSDYILLAHPTDSASPPQELKEITPQRVSTCDDPEDENIEDSQIQVPNIKIQKSEDFEYALRGTGLPLNSFPLSLFKSKRWRIIPLLLYPYTGCFCTSLTMTLSRGLSGMALSEDSKGSFEGVMPKLYVIGIILNGVFSYYMLNKALKNFNTVYVSPLFKAGDLFHNLLSGGIFLREFGEYDGWGSFLGFLGGIVVCIGSICMLLLGNDRVEVERDGKDK